MCEVIEKPLYKKHKFCKTCWNCFETIKVRNFIDYYVDRVYVPHMYDMVIENIGDKLEYHDKLYILPRATLECYCDLIDYLYGGSFEIKREEIDGTYIVTIEQIDLKKICINWSFTTTNEKKEAMFNMYKKRLLTKPRIK